jgi:hypothetical protein
MKWGYDSMKIRGDIYDFDLDGSFYYTSVLLYFAGDSSAGVIVFLSSIIWVYVVTSFVKEKYTSVVYLVAFVPMCLLNLIWPAKETVVILMTVLCCCLLKRANALSLALVVVLYAAYAYFVRSYYFIILAIFLFLFAAAAFRNRPVYIYNLKFFKLNKKFFVILAAFFVSFSFLLPYEFYELSQGQRDVSNNYALLEGSFNVTSFYNVVEVQPGVNFILNYLWAILNIFFPFMAGVGVNQLLLFLFNCAILFCFYSCSKLKLVEPCFLMFFAHLFVLLIFEPDQGSYLRHILSSSVYLFPFLSSSVIRFYEK